MSSKYRDMIRSSSKILSQYAPLALSTRVYMPIPGMWRAPVFCFDSLVPAARVPLSTPSFRAVRASTGSRVCAPLFLPSCVEIMSNARIGNLVIGSELIACARQLPYIVAIDGSVNGYVRIRPRTSFSSRSSPPVSGSSGFRSPPSAF